MINISKNSNTIVLKLLPTKLVGECNSRKVYRHEYDGKWYSPHKLKLVLQRVYNTTLEEVLLKLANNLEEYNLTCPHCNKNEVIVRAGKKSVLEILPYCEICKNSGILKSHFSKKCANRLRNTINPDTGLSLLKEKVIKSRDTCLSNDPNFYKNAVSKRDYTKYNKSLKYFKDTKLQYQSSYELRFLLKMESDGLLEGIDNAPPIKKYYKSKCYYPDFYIESSNTIVEIKSMYILKEVQGLKSNLMKFRRVLSLGYNLLLVIDNQYHYFYDISEIESFMSKLKTGS